MMSRIQRDAEEMQMGCRGEEEGERLEKECSSQVPIFQE